MAKNSRNGAPLHERISDSMHEEDRAYVTKCWVWQKYLTQGYGGLGIDGKHKMAHRVSYELFRGPIPEGLQIDHLCKVRSCVNPDHLEAVTLAENVARSSINLHYAAKRALTHCKKGHEFTEMNTYRSKDGRRNCRACRRVVK